MAERDPEAVAQWYSDRHDFEHAALILAVRSIMRVQSEANNRELRGYAFPLIYEIGRLQAQLAARDEVIAQLQAQRVWRDDVILAARRFRQRYDFGGNGDITPELDALRNALDAAEVPSQEARQQAAERAVQAGIVLPGPTS